MPTDPSKPRYRVPKSPKERPRRSKKGTLDLTPEHPGKGWARSLFNVLLTAIVPTILLWWWTVTLSEYKVVFATPVSDVTLDGKPVRLGYANSISIPRTPLDEHRLRYSDAAGKPVEMRLHPSPFDDDAKPLTISGDRATGGLRAETVGG